MKTRAFLIALSQLLLVCCLFAQPSQQSGWQVLSLKGKVKELTEIILSEKDTVPNRMVNHTSEYKFNEQGYIIEDSRTPLKGNGKPIIGTTEFDGNNNFVKISHGKYVVTFKNEYDNRNKLIKQTEYDSLMQVKVIDSFIYDNVGRLVEKVYLNIKDSLPERTIVTYDNKDAATYKKYSKKGTLLYVTVYAANMSNDIVCGKTYKSDGSLYQTTEYKYDRSGNRIGVRSYGRMENTKHTLTFNEHNDQMTNTVIVYKPSKAIYKYTSVYEYDEHGNWTSQIIYKQGEKFRTITRQITYY